jgi:hypothetical protein
VERKQMSESERQRRAEQSRRDKEQSRRDKERNGSYTIQEWCEHRRVSRAMLYKLFQQGRGPRTHNVGTKRLISSEADAAWVREREAEAAAEAA